MHSEDGESALAGSLGGENGVYDPEGRQILYDNVSEHRFTFIVGRYSLRCPLVLRPNNFVLSCFTF